MPGTSWINAWPGIPRRTGLGVGTSSMRRGEGEGCAEPDRQEGGSARRQQSSKPSPAGNGPSAGSRRGLREGGCVLSGVVWRVTELGAASSTLEHPDRGGPRDRMGRGEQRAPELPPSSSNTGLGGAFRSQLSGEPMTEPPQHPDEHLSTHTCTQAPSLGTHGSHGTAPRAEAGEPPSEHPRWQSWGFPGSEMVLSPSLSDLPW